VVQGNAGGVGALLRPGFHIGARDVVSLDELACDGHDGLSTSGGAGGAGDLTSDPVGGARGRDALAHVRLAESRARYFDPAVDLHTMLEDFVLDPDAAASMDTLLRGSL
jgi:hypothetical protein